MRLSVLLRRCVVTAAVLSGSALTGCSSSEHRETTVHCMRCHKRVSSEAVVCTDCAAPRDNPAIVQDDPAPTTPPGTTPTANTTPTSTNTPRRAATARDARTLFLNNFAQAESDQVEAEMLRDPDYVEVTPGGGAPGRRVNYDFKYVGTNLKASLVHMMRKLGFRFHFTEARLQDQVELVKE